MKSFLKNSEPGREAVVWLTFLTGVQNYHYCFGSLSAVTIAETKKEKKKQKEKGILETSAGF